MHPRTQWFVGALLAASVAACSTTDVVAPPPMLAGPSVSLDSFETGLRAPQVRVGDVFVYDNPVERMEVVAVGDQFIDYQDGQGGYKKATWSPILPVLRWGSDLSAGNRTLTKLSGALHPLVKGNRIVFVEDVIRARPGSAYRSTWECEVQDRVSITVKAGTSDTWQVLCHIDGRERALLNYAEDIGGLVRMIYRMDDGSTIVRQLTAFGRRVSEPADPTAAGTAKP